MKQMRKYLGVLLGLAVLVTLLTTTVLATNVSEIVYASNLVDGDDIVLIGDTTLYVNADVSLKSISGDYALEIQSDGEHTLTVDNPNGSAIYVKTLKSVKPSQGTVNLTVKGGDDYFAIATTGDISLDGIKLDAKGGAGIRSEEGNVTINGTNVSVVGSDGIGVVANSGSIYIDSDYLFVQCAGQSGDAYWEHGIGAVKDITIISDDATITGRWGVYSDKGSITLSGNIWVGATRCAVIANEGTITMTGAVTAQGGDEYYVIAASGDISFEGTKLDVAGSSGIRSAEGDITINGTNVSVVGQDGVGVIANSGSINIDSDYLFVQCAGQSGDAEWEHGIGAVKDITIISDDATITGRWGVYSETGSVTLWGNVWVGARKTAIHAEKNIVVHGDLTANNTDQDYFCIVSADGDITLSNGTINVASTSNAVITHNGNIYLNGNITAKSSEAGSCAINAREGDIVIQGGSLDVTAGGNYAMYAYNGQIGMNQPLELLVPENGHIDTNTIVDTNGDPASHVEIATVMKDAVSISINAPVAGEKPVSSANGVYGLPAHTSVKSIEWFVSDIPHGNNEPFVAGQNYKVKIVLKADAGYRFASGVLAKLNGKDATTGWSNGGKELIITYTFSDCPASIQNVALTVTAPSDGNSISYSVTDESAGYSVGNNSNYVSWYVSDDGVSYTLMSSGNKFVGGKYYKIEMIVKTHTGYEFALKDVGSIQPDVSATVNGFKATVSKGYEQDPSEEITVTYIFGLCNDTIIEDIKIVDVPKPVPGEKPVYTVAVSGTGYSITNKNTSQEVYEGGQYVEKYYIRNGIGWYDVTADNWIYETDTFIAGHDYQCVVYVQTDTGYEFVQDLYADPAVWPTATVNGNAATILKEGSGLIWNQQVMYTFQWQPITVTEINITGLDAPVAGENPDFDVELNEGHDQLYSVSVTWYEYYGDGNYGAPVVEDATFAKNTVYRAEIVLEPKKDAQYVNLCSFAVSEQTIRINGKSPVEPWLSNTYVSVSYDFQTVTEIEPSANVSGFVQADFGTVKPSAALYRTNDTELTNPLYTAEIGSAVKNGDRFDWAFTISGVPAGTYDLVITKDGHKDSVQRITVSNANKNMGVIALSALATSAWSGDTCTVTRQVFESGVIVVVASYEDGKMVKVEYLTVEDPTAILTGDNVKVFFLENGAYVPVRKAMELQP